MQFYIYSLLFDKKYDLYVNYVYQVDGCTTSVVVDGECYRMGIDDV